MRYRAYDELDGVPSVIVDGSAHPDSPDAAACLGYASHRLGNDAGSLYWLRRALELDASYSEARIYLANLLYDRGETEAALHQLERTQPEDHFDELGIWRHIELKKTVYRLPDEDPEPTTFAAITAALTTLSPSLSSKASGPPLTCRTERRPLWIVVVSRERGAIFTGALSRAKATPSVRLSIVA